MKKLLLLAICFSFNAEAVTVSNSCIASCTASCEAPKKSVKKPVKKGKKHAKKLPKKAIVKPVIVDQKTEPTKCEPVTEYVYLSGYDAGWGGRELNRSPEPEPRVQLPNLPTQENDTERDATRGLANINYPLNPQYVLIRPIASTHYQLPKIPERGIPINPPVNSVPLPAAVFMFLSGMALVFGRKIK